MVFGRSMSDQAWASDQIPRRPGVSQVPSDHPGTERKKRLEPSGAALSGVSL